MKSIIAASALLASGSAALAGPYVRGEVEFRGIDNDYGSTKTQARVGYEYDKSSKVAPYVEIGGGVIAPDRESSQGLFAVETGLRVNVTDKLTAKASAENLRYDDSNRWKVKLGAKYAF